MTRPVCLMKASAKFHCSETPIWRFGARTVSAKRIRCSAPHWTGEIALSRPSAEGR